MADTVKIDLEENSKYRVALDLAYKIAHNESKFADGDRNYWLKLFQQTRNVVLSGVVQS